MEFEWDEAKNRTNRVKHGISFETARQAFFDPYAIFELDRHVDGEERWRVTGSANGIALLLVAHTYRGGPDGQEIVRIISARVAERPEQRTYDRARLGQN